MKPRLVRVAIHGAHVDSHSAVDSHKKRTPRYAYWLTDAAQLAAVKLAAHATGVSVAELVHQAITVMLGESDLPPAASVPHVPATGT